MLAVSSPTYDDVPAFQWSKVDFGINFENDGLRVKADLVRVEDKH